MTFGKHAYKLIQTKLGNRTTSTRVMTNGHNWQIVLTWKKYKVNPGKFSKYDIKKGDIKINQHDVYIKNYDKIHN